MLNRIASFPRSSQFFNRTKSPTGIEWKVKESKMLPMSSSSLLVGIQTTEKQGILSPGWWACSHYSESSWTSPLPLSFCLWKVREMYWIIFRALAAPKIYESWHPDAEHMPQLSLKSITGIETLAINQVQNMGREETESENNACWVTQTFLRKN